MKMGRKIISLALIITMIFAVAAFMSCGESEKEEEIRINVQIIGSNYEDGNDLVLTGTADELTVLAATQRMCEVVLEIKFEYDAKIDTVKRIGDDISGLFESEYEDEIAAKEEPDEAAAADPGDGEEPADAENPDGEEPENPEDVVKDFYFDWVLTVNGSADANLSDKIKEGDKIVWKYQEVKKELTEGKK